jgi:RNAse (barnase) inhibitor barstar
MIFIAREEALPELRDLYAELAGRAENRDELFAELAAALQFPEYSGRNWDAVEECLGELEDPPDLVVRNARTLWERLPHEMLLLADVWLDQAPRAKLVFLW